MSRKGAARRMARQHALITGEQATELGLTRAEVRTELRSGRWIRVARNLYRSASAPVTWEQRALAACLAGAYGTVVSHRSAAVLWGLEGFRPGGVEVTVPRGRSVRNPLASIVHCRGTLEVYEVTRIGGVPTTGCIRTLIDVASVVGPDKLATALDDALCRRLVTLQALRGRLEALRAPGRATGALQAALAVWTPGALPANVAEVRLARCLLAHGLPMPERQHVIRYHGRFVARVDLAYPQARVAIESQSFRWHDSPRVRNDDRARLNRITAAGWQVFQATPADVVRAGDQLCSSLARVLAHAAERGWGAA